MMRSILGLSRRAIVYHNYVHAWNGLHEVIENGSSEPAAIPRLSTPTHDDVGDAVFLGERIDGTYKVRAFESEGGAAQLPGKLQIVADFPLRNRIDVFCGFARRLHIHCIPGGAQTIGNPGGLAQ